MMENPPSLQPAYVHKVGVLRAQIQTQLFILALQSPKIFLDQIVYYSRELLIPP